jgi:predicted nucleic acid-binding protein
VCPASAIRLSLTVTAIAATANVYGATVLSHNAKDLKIVEDLVDVRTP